MRNPIGRRSDATGFLPIGQSLIDANCSLTNRGAIALHADWLTVVTGSDALAMTNSVICE